MSSNPIFSLLSTLEQYPIADTAFRDTLGNNIPKIALTRTKTERMDVAISQIGNALSFVCGGLGVDFLLKQWFAKAQQGAVNSTKYRWAVASRSVAIYSTMASAMWAMPFIRNYMVTKRTGSISFSDVIQSGGAKAPDTPQQKAALNANLKDSKKKALTILGIGAAGVVGPALFGRWAGASAKEAGKEFGHKFLETIFKNPLTKPFMLEGGAFSKLAGIPSMMFWGIPSYIGWYHASRDPYEKQEVGIRAANFLACFFGPTPLINNLLQGKFTKNFNMKEMAFSAVKEAYDKGKITEATKIAADSFLVKKNLFTIGVSIVLLGVTPQLLNIYLTKRRMSKAQQLNKQPLPVPNPSQMPPAPQAQGPTPATPVMDITQANLSPAYVQPQPAPEAGVPTSPQFVGSPHADPNGPVAPPFPPLGPYVTGFPPVRLGSRAAFG